MNKESWHAGFLAKLAPRFRTKLLGLAHSSCYPARTTIFREGDPSLYFYLIKSGPVALDIAVPGKGVACLLTVGPGDIFSWSALLESHAETATARAIEEVEVLGIKGEALQYLCWEDTELGVEFYRALAEVIAARLSATRLVVLPRRGKHNLVIRGGLPPTCTRKTSPENGVEDQKLECGFDGAVPPL